jgi:L-amino acid N-acyltransferase YncA
MRWGVYLSPPGTQWGKYRSGQFRGNEKRHLLHFVRQFCCIYTTVPIRLAQAADLPEIVAIYNASIPGRMATADTAPVTVAQRESWFREFDGDRRPLWVYCDEADGPVRAWLSLRSFYGRPAYQATVETGVYVAPTAQRRGLALALLAHAVSRSPALSIRTLLAFVFAHNVPSIALFERMGFSPWGRLPRVAELDRVERDLVILGRRVGAGGE